MRTRGPSSRSLTCGWAGVGLSAPWALRAEPGPLGGWELQRKIGIQQEEEISSKRSFLKQTASHKVTGSLTG